MKTLVSRISANVFRGASLMALAATILTSEGAFAQKCDNGLMAMHTEKAVKSESTTPAPAGFKAVMYASANPMKLKVNFENPAKERVVLVVRNNSGAAVFSDVLGRSEIYNGKLDISALPDGEYTMILQSASSKYEQTFSIQTETARLASVK
jgi:hypothetical protein